MCIAYCRCKPLIRNLLRKKNKDKIIVNNEIYQCMNKNIRKRNYAKITNIFVHLIHLLTKYELLKCDIGRLCTMDYYTFIDGTSQNMSLSNSFGVML